MAKATKPKLTGREKLERLLKNRATISPDELHQTGEMGGRNGIYGACDRGEIECFRRGKRIFIVTSSLRRLLGIEAA